MAFTYAYESRLIQTRGAPCSGLVSTYGSMAVRGTEVIKLPPEHRVKPKPLDMTSRARQSTASVTCRVHRYYYGTEVWRCYATNTWDTIPRTSWDYYIPSNLTEETGTITFRDIWIYALRQKIQSDKISFAETLGEWREALGLAESCAKTFVRAGKLAKIMLKRRGKARALKRWFRSQFGRGPESKLQLQDAVQVDLAIKFGIQPNLTLLQDALEAAGRARSRKRKIKVTVPEKQEKKTPGIWGGTLIVRGERSNRIVAYVTYDVNSSDFTAGNLGSALWAGTSMSFVVDWFWNVGGYLESFNALKGVQSFRAARMVRTSYRMTDTRNSGNADKVCVTPGIYSYRYHERTVLSFLPYADVPPLELPTTELWGRLQTLIEILVMQRKGVS